MLKQATADATSKIKPLQNFEGEWTQVFALKVMLDGTIRNDDF